MKRARPSRKLGSHPPLRALAAAGLAALLALPTGCGGSSLNPDEPRREGPIRIGTMWPTSGVLAVVGADFIKGWQLCLKEHDNKLGGFDITVTDVDEGEGQQSARDGIRKLIDQDQIEVMVGTISSEAMMAVLAATSEAKIPYIGTGGRVEVFPPDISLDFAWHVSFKNGDTGRALAPYLKETIDGPIWAIGPDFAGGWSWVGGFVEPYTAIGGELANPDGEATFTPYPGDGNYIPYLNQILASEAKAVYAFFAGANAIAFIKQYAQVIGDQIPLYAAGPATDGNALLAAMGTDADGVYSVFNYAADLDNPANRAFVSAFQKEYGEPVGAYAMLGFDGCQVLDLAIAAAGPEPTAESINAALAQLGTVHSPRGDWRFGAGHTPTQPWYLRQVRVDGRGRTNVVIETLAVVGDEGAEQ